MKKVLNYLLMGVFVLATYDTIWASVQTDIEKAKKAGKTVFLVVTEPGITGEEKAVSIANQAHKSVAKSTVIEMNRADSTNREIVTKYRLAGAPLPLILTIASNGVVTGGLTVDRATPESLVKMIPSPKKAEVLQALSEKKAVFVVASRKSMVDRAKIFDTCKDTCSQMKNKAAFVSIDMDDKKENSFLSQLKINILSTEPVTAVINPQGRITGTFNGSVEVKKLVQAAAKKASGGCCPGGSKKGCGPSNQKGK
jgi:hypothetical protein